MASGGASPAPSIMNGNSPAPHALSNLNPNAPTTTRPVKICVFCGASPGKSPAHLAAARALAHTMAAQNISLVYGGGTVGLMGEVARTLVSLSGPESVHGIIPAPLVKYERGPDSEAASTFSTDSSEVDGEGENANGAGDGKGSANGESKGNGNGEKKSKGVPDYETYGKTTVVKDMHTRKQMMAQEVLSGGPGSGFVALPGGYGTLEELMEVVTWNQLGIHNRGVVVLNVEGYWDGLLSWVEGAVGAGFVGEGNRGIIRECGDGEEAVKALRDYRVAEGRFKLEWGNE